MKTKLFLLSFIPTLIIMFALNGVFHAGVASSFFDSHLTQFGSVIRPMKDGHILPLIILEFNLVFVMTYFITLPYPGKIMLKQAMIAGGLINLVTSGTWSLANASMFEWQISLTIVDMLWHTILGAGGGYLIGVIYNNRRLKMGLS